MAKTIAQLTELAETPSGTDTLPIYDSGVTKKVSVTNLSAAARTIPDGSDISVGTTTGTKVGTSTSQKLGFFNATPVVQPLLTADLLDSMQALGLVASGAGNTPLNLTGGSLTAGTAAFGNLTADDVTVRDGKNIVLDTTTGTKIGTSASQKLGFFNATPVVQPAAISNSSTSTSDLSSKLNSLLQKMRDLGLIAT